MTKKLIFWFSLSLLIVSAICAGSYAYAQPKFNQAITATKTKQTEVAKLSTDVFMETEFSIAKTQTAMPTSTPSPTVTATPTNTITLTIPATKTNTPVLSSCTIKLNSDAYVYPLPSTGSEGKMVSESDTIQLLASVEKLNWAEITVNTEPYWVKFDDIQRSCETITLPLPYLMGWKELGNVIFYDNNASIYTWVDQNNSNITPKLIAHYNPNNAYYLPLDSNQISQASIKNQPFGYMGNFTLITSYLWKNSNGDVGIKFWDNGTNYYEVRINNQCGIGLYDTGESIFSRDTGEKNCFYDHSNILQLSVQSSDDSSTISMVLNGKNEILANLPNHYIGDQISWNLYGASFDVNYFAIIEQ
jgi:hypothetical protein